MHLALCIFTETKLFHFHRIFKNGGQRGGFKRNPLWIATAKRKRIWSGSTTITDDGPWYQKEYTLEQILTLCMLGYFAFLCGLVTFFFQKRIIKQFHESNSLDPDQDRQAFCQGYQ